MFQHTVQKEYYAVSVVSSYQRNSMLCRYLICVRFQTKYYSVSFEFIVSEGILCCARVSRSWSVCRVSSFRIVLLYLRVSSFINNFYAVSVEIPVATSVDTASALFSAPPGIIRMLYRFLLKYYI